MIIGMRSSLPGEYIPPVASFLLLRNAVDKLLLRDGVSKLQLGH